VPTFRRPPRNPPRRPRCRQSAPQETAYFRATSSLLAMAQLLPFVCRDRNVVRAAALSIVLMLTVGQNATLLCNVWCHPIEGTPAAGCGHPNTSPRVTSNEDCRDTTLAPIAVVREEGRRGPSAPHAQPQGVVSWLSFARVTPAARSDHPPDQRLLPAARPLVLALRV
jgi:hypothetical protein